MRWISQLSSFVWMRANLRDPRLSLCRVAMTSLPSRHFSSSNSPKSQIVTSPAPYSPAGIVPSNVP